MNEQQVRTIIKEELSAELEKRDYVTKSDLKAELEKVIADFRADFRIVVFDALTEQKAYFDSVFRKQLDSTNRTLKLVQEQMRSFSDINRKEHDIFEERLQELEMPV